jgi:predicted small secreted protein
MKLNFNFSGKTLLKDWWKIVRDNFTAIQTEHNTLSNKLDTEITQRTNADVGLADKITAETKVRESADSSLNSRINNEVTIRQAADNELQRNIDSEITERQTADTNISNSVKAEESARKSADKELKARIDEINANTETTILFGDKKQHTVKFVAPSKPTLYFDGQQEYYGESMAVDITLKDAFYIDGKQIAGTFSEPCINVPIDGIYIVVRYDFIKNTCSISSNSTSVPSAISGDVWTFTLYHIHDINLEMKIDSESPTGERYEFVSATVDYVIENENTTGDSYFITNTYERVRTLADLATVNKNSFIDAVNENAKNITDITKNQIFVQCDGDHDELKLQAAIDSAPYKSIIYPVGELCVITNANMKSGYGMTGTNNGVAIPLKGGMTLDGSMCDTIMFKNTNSVAKQYVFHLPEGAKMQNVKFTEDTDTVTADTVNPTVLLAQSSSQIISCTFYDIFSTHQFGVSTFEMSNVLFLNNVIDTFAGAPANNLTYEIKIAGNSFVMGNKFLNFTQKEQSLGYMLQASTVIFVNNYMSGFTNCSIDIGKKIVGNIFKTFTDCSIDINGEISDNEFAAITQNTKTPFIYTKGITLISGNRMPVIKINSEYIDFIDFIECGNYAVICGNYMHISAGPTSGQCNLISASSQTLIADNIFRTTASVTANADFSIIYSDGKTVVKNNVTNAVSIGTFGDTCVVDGNVTGW